MQFLKNISLKPYNTFGIDVSAKYFFVANTIDSLKWLVTTATYKNNKVLWLGGGSNMLLTTNFNGLVVKLNLKGISTKALNKDETLVCALAGENWHQFVLYTLQANLGGLENLSLIPGNVGTAPVQNIGAYGVEIKDTFYKLKAFNLSTGEVEIFDKAKCNFKYRDSYFKQEGKGKYIVVEVCFCLTNHQHQLQMDYGAIREALQKLGGEPNITKVSDAVISIRQSKLPNPAELGNSGSFFKNPVVSNSLAKKVKEKFPNVVMYPAGADKTKLAAGWLIEQCGFKGYRKGDAGVHKNQALVLVNYGKATGAEIAALAEDIKQAVFSKFAVPLEAEVNII